jgi:putative transposase
MGVKPSMGSVGDAYDNAMAESFFATLDCELLNRRRFKTQSRGTPRHIPFYRRLVQPTPAALCAE